MSSVPNFGANIAFIEELYEKYRANPDSVDVRWREFFKNEAAEFRGSEVAEEEPVASAQPGNLATPQPVSKPTPVPPPIPGATVLRGAASKIVQNMEASLAVPTATSVRNIPVKVLEENRRIINNHLTLSGQAKASYTHIIAWAIVKSIREYPRMNAAFAMNDGAPTRIDREEVNLGVSKVMTMTSTYDHRIIQGAESGAFLARIHELLLGADDFYDHIYRDLRIPYEPVHWSRDRAHFRADSEESVARQARVLQMINAYRVRGHLLADLDPLEYEVKRHPELDPAFYGFTLWDFDRDFVCGGLCGKVTAKLRDILDTLRETYCGKIGPEYMHIQETVQKRWLQDRMEPTRNQHPLDLAIKRRILMKLNDAEALEKFLHTKYVGHKRFSLEGAESVIPMLDYLFNEATADGVQEAVIGMAHRGRLNVLANTLGKSYEKIFNEFEGDIDPNTTQGSGDVKYHLGADGMHQTPSGSFMKLTLASNPSHLEAVDPIVEGMVRAKQKLIGDRNRSWVLPLLIHGDAAFAGQGVVAETLNLSQLRGYRTGGTIHLVINNQIGFTTGPESARSSMYATDVAKAVQAPIFHVNGDDPEACIRAIRLAYEFRQQFHKDVVIDMLCYRRHGHNEGDEPSLTQPRMYKAIKEHRSVRKIYTEQLLRKGDIDPKEADEWLDQFQSKLQEAFERTKTQEAPHAGRDPRY